VEAAVLIAIVTVIVVMVLIVATSYYSPIRPPITSEVIDGGSKSPDHAPRTINPQWHR